MIIKQRPVDAVDDVARGMRAHTIGPELFVYFTSDRLSRLDTGGFGERVDCHAVVRLNIDQSSRASTPRSAGWPPPSA